MECSPVAMLPINSPKVKKKRYVINLSWNPSTGVKRTPAVFPARPNYHNKATTLWDFLLPPWSFIFPRRKTLGLGRTEFKMKPHNKALPHQGTHSIPLKAKEKPRTRSTHEGQIWAFSTSPKLPWPGLTWAHLFRRAGDLLLIWEIILAFSPSSPRPILRSVNLNKYANLKDGENNSSTRPD